MYTVRGNFPLGIAPSFCTDGLYSLLQYYIHTLCDTDLIAAAGVAESSVGAAGGMSAEQLP